MKLLIKILIAGIIIGVVVFYIGLTIYGKALLANIASRILQTEVKVASVKFIPNRLSLKLSTVTIPDKEIVFTEGIVHLAPLKIELQGLEIMRKLKIIEDNLSLCAWPEDLLSRSRTWQVVLNFKNVDLAAISSIYPDIWSYGFTDGTLDGKMDGIYCDEQKCEFYGLFHFYNMIYDESVTERRGGILGISAEEIVRFIQDNDGSIDLDFGYKGPLNELNNPSMYRPGPKIMRSLGVYLIKKVSQKNPAVMSR